MKASEAHLLRFLQQSSQFMVPIYQRSYSWTIKECEKLWDDILRVGLDDSVPSHFLGSIVYVEDGLYNVSMGAPLLVIDGQQRLTSVSLLLAALAGCLGEHSTVEGFAAKQVRDEYLVDPRKTGDRRFKLLLSKADRESYLSIIEGIPRSRAQADRVTDNFTFFREQLAAVDDVQPICRGLLKLLIVDISLDRDRDNPQLIFESLNSTGKELSQADLIRNYVLMGLEPDTQTNLYHRYWRPMEQEFGREAYRDHFDRFMRHFLTIKAGSIPKISEVYEEFKKSASGAQNHNNLETLLAELHNFARYYCAIAFDNNSTDPQLEKCFNGLRELNMDVPYPFVMEVYDDYSRNALRAEEFCEIIRLVESYIFRRAVCAIPTNSMNKTFATLAKQIDKERYFESVRAAFLLLPSYRRFPKDEEFMRELKTRDLYRSRNRSYCLRKLENWGRKEPVAVHEYTIEHILPQNDELSSWWQQALGPKWREIQEQWLHTLGNLTLTGYNSEYSDRPFSEKRDMDGGFSESPLRLNQGLAKLDTWNEDTIRQRADDLSLRAVDIWEMPTLPESILESYRPEQRNSHYSLTDHRHIAPGGPMADLFQALRKEVLKLDSNVSEEFLKLYVAYKAETNFVDAVPQAGQLRLSLNMPFPEIDDPKRICTNVAGKGRWGNGDVEIQLRDESEIPYVIGLIRQSLERQLGNGDEVDS